MSLFKNIKSYYPKDSDETEKIAMKCHKRKGPTFISLKRIIKSEKTGRRIITRTFFVNKLHNSTKKII